jgi:hypothetical protein
MKLILFCWIAILLINFCKKSIECEIYEESYCIIFKSNETDYITLSSIDWMTEKETKYEDSFGIIFKDFDCNCTIDGQMETLTLEQTKWLLNISTTHYQSTMNDSEHFMYAITLLCSIVWCLFFVYGLTFESKFY